MNVVPITKQQFLTACAKPPRTFPFLQEKSWFATEDNQVVGAVIFDTNVAAWAVGVLVKQGGAMRPAGMSMGLVSQTLAEANLRELMLKEHAKLGGLERN